MPLSNEEISAHVLSFEATFFPHDRYKEAISAIEQLRLRWRPRQDGVAEVDSRCVVIVGNPGAGKTTVVKRYAANFAVDTSDTLVDVKRVILVQAARKTTPKQLAEVILKALEPKFVISARDSAKDIMEMICERCDALGTELIIIDESHHIVDGKGDDSIHDIAEFIKSLLNTCNAQIVLCGLPHLLTKLPKTKEMQQLRRRTIDRINLKPYNWSSVEGRLAFRAILAVFENALPLPEPSGLLDVEIAARIYCATGGEIGLVVKHLSIALRLALERDLPKITADLLAEAFLLSEETTEGSAEIMLDFDAAPISPDPSIGRDENPYSATIGALRELWRKMAGTRWRESSRKTRHRMTGPKKARVI